MSEQHRRAATYVLLVLVATDALIGQQGRAAACRHPPFSGPGRPALYKHLSPPPPPPAVPQAGAAQPLPPPPRKYRTRPPRPPPGIATNQPPSPLPAPAPPRMTPPAPPPPKQRPPPLPPSPAPPAPVAKLPPAKPPPAKPTPAPVPAAKPTPPLAKPPPRPPPPVRKPAAKPPPLAKPPPAKQPPARPSPPRPKPPPSPHPSPPPRPPVAKPSPSPPPACVTMYGYIATHSDFSMLTRYVNMVPNVRRILDDPRANYTFLAPINKAFGFAPPMDTRNATALSTMLLGHVLIGRMTTEDMQRVDPSKLLTRLAGEPVTVSIYAYSGLLSDNKKNNQQPFVSGPDPSAAFRPIPDYNTDSSGPGPSGTGFAPSEPSPLRPLPDPNAGGGGGEVPGPSTPDDPFRPLPDPNTGGSGVPSSPDGSQSLPPMITVQTPDFMQIVSLDMSQVDIAACQSVIQAVTNAFSIPGTPGGDSGGFGPFA